MRQLRHVECDTFYVPGPPLSNVQDGSLMLANLQTFKEIVNLRLCDEVCKFISNIQKLHLTYHKDMKGYDNSFVTSLCNLNRFHKLESVNLAGSYESLFPDGEVEKKQTISFPRSLKKLYLTCFEVVLEVLKLQKIVGKGGQWSPVEGQFHRLKFLEICGCDLYRWDAEESHFPVLEKLILIRLLYLEEIPLCIGNIPTLEFLRVEKCNFSTAISAVRIKEDQLEVRGTGNLDRFIQILETEELTVDNIKLRANV